MGGKKRALEGMSKDKRGSEDGLSTGLIRPTNSFMSLTSPNLDQRMCMCVCVCVCVMRHSYDLTTPVHILAIQLCFGNFAATR